ncbi:MAG: ribosome silencing factor [Myxococcales bacterium]|nr:ribosome silencing factor [Myxococcales bacterium]
MAEPNVEMVQAVAEAIWEKKGFDVVAYVVDEVLDYTDCMIVASAGSDRQTLAIADSVEQTMRDKFADKPFGREGRANARWVLLDFSDVVVHIFHRPVRDYYELDRLYGDMPRVALEEPEWVKQGADPTSDWASADDYNEPVWDEDDDEDSEPTEAMNDQLEAVSSSDQGADE